MVHMMGPSLDAELDYRRASLLLTASAVARPSRRARRADRRADRRAAHAAGRTATAGRAAASPRQAA